MARLRLMTAGESHGPALVAILEGLPHGLRVDEAAVERGLARRQGGLRPRRAHEDREGRGAGARRACAAGVTLGAPLAMMVPQRRLRQLDRRDASVHAAGGRARQGADAAAAGARRSGGRAQARAARRARRARAIERALDGGAGGGGRGVQGAACARAASRCSVTWRASPTSEAPALRRARRRAAARGARRGRGVGGPLRRRRAPGGR